MRRALAILGLAALAAAGLGLWVTAPQSVDAALPDDLRGDPVAGEAVFTAAGCASCHHAPDAEGDAQLVLSGGQTFSSDFGTFVAPNISPDPDHGIGTWTLADFANAVQAGVSPEGRHYYPAFPYGAYARMTPQDVADLWAYMQTLPETDTPSQAHDVAFPMNIRRGLGVWKALFLTEDWVTEADTPELRRGRYLVEALAHCGECHTPRGALGGLERDLWLTGAANPSGSGRIPTLRPPAFDWSTTDIAYYLETGFTPEFDSAGGHMVAVIENFAKLPVEDRQAVASYLKALPPVD